MRISDWSSDVCSSDLALFLGRLAVGYSVRAFILYNLILPSLFGAVWMTAIAGATTALDQQSGAGLYAILTAQGPDPVLFRLFSALGGGPVVAAIVLFAIFLSYVAGAAANVSAMSALSTHGISPERPERRVGKGSVRTVSSRWAPDY